MVWASAASQLPSRRACSSGSAQPAPRWWGCSWDRGAPGRPKGHAIGQKGRPKALASVTGGGAGNPKTWVVFSANAPVVVVHLSGPSPMQNMTRWLTCSEGLGRRIPLCSAPAAVQRTTLPRLGVGMARQGMARRGIMTGPGVSRFGTSRTLALLNGRCRLLRVIRVGSGLGLAWLSLPVA